MLLDTLRMLSLPWLPVLLALTYIMSEVSASGTLKLQLLVYENPNGRDADGGKCDTTMGIRTSDCDPYFKICIGPSDSTACSYLEKDSSVYRDSNTVRFGSSLGNSITNPMMITIPTWPTAGIKIKIRVFDEDSRSGHDLIDTLTAVVNSSPSPSADTSSTRDVTIRGRTNLFGRVTAYCDADWYGNQCDTYCVPHDDVTNGHYTCSDTGEVTCRPGYVGQTCTDDYDECSSNPCQNQGECNNLQNQFQCQCLPGYTGIYCELEINECLSDPCVNGGACNNLVNEFSCTCAEGFTGSTCDDVVDYCATMECRNGGVCVQVALSATCQCEQGFTGDECETDIDDCVGGPCEGDGSTCNDLVNTFSCTCGPDRTGPTCSDIIYPDTTASPPDLCERSPCATGTCEQVGASFTCHCPSGFSGQDCAVDACSGSPCGDNATCTHADNDVGYQCSSSSECGCMNGGYCEEGSDVSTTTGFTCTCQPGFTGEICDVMSSTCQDEPCMHGGTCHDNNHGYYCTCMAQFEGEHCEKISHEDPSLPQVFLFVGPLDQHAIGNLELSIISLVSEHTDKPADTYRLTYDTHQCLGNNGTKVTIFTFQVVDELNDLVPWYTLEEIFGNLRQAELYEILPRPFYKGTDCSTGSRVDQSRSPYPVQIWPIVVGVVALALVVGIISAVVIAYKRKHRSGRFDVVSNPLFDEHHTRRGTTDTTLSIGSEEQSTQDMSRVPVYFHSPSQEYPGGTGLDLTD